MNGYTSVIICDINKYPEGNKTQNNKFDYYDSNKRKISAGAQEAFEIGLFD